MNYETENIEFKSHFTEKIYKEVIAFANTDGSTIYVGIDDGNVVGIENVDDELSQTVFVTLLCPMLPCSFDSRYRKTKS